MSAELIIRMYGAHQIIILVCIQQSLRFFQHMPLQPVSPVCTTHNCRIHDCNMGKLFLIKIKISSQIIFPVFRIFNNEETRNRTICCLCHDHKTLFFYMCPDIFLIIRYKPVRMLFIILRFMHNSHDLIHICHLCFSYPEQYLCRTILIL